MAHPSADALRRYQRHLRAEWDAATLYAGLARLSEGRRRDVLTELAGIEEKHAGFWADQIREIGGTPPARSDFRPSGRTLSLLETARRHSTDLVLQIVEQDELEAASGYADEPSAPVSMREDEAGHAAALADLLAEDTERVAGAEPSPERWHRSDKSGTLRAAIFGINDGLVSNTALVLGFAGAGTGRTTVLLAGLAGWLAGAFSMASGEYISMTNQREAFERELELERAEITEHPDQERRELELIYQAKGVDEVTARYVAEQIMSDPGVALNTMAREELGLDPDDLGSPLRAAFGSFLSFSLGAILIVVPYLVTSGSLALVMACAVALAALAVVGALMARTTGRPVGRGVLRQMLVGALAAGATYAFGTLFGVTVS